MQYKFIASVAIFFCYFLLLFSDRVSAKPWNEYTDAEIQQIMIENDNRNPVKNCYRQHRKLLSLLNDAYAKENHEEFDEYYKLVEAKRIECEKFTFSDYYRAEKEILEYPLGKP
jgi:hypothetical protein